MKTYLVLIILLIALQKCGFASKKQQHRMYFSGCNCINYDKKILKRLECFLTPDANGQQMMNVRLMVGQDIARDLKWLITITTEINRRNITYINTTLDYCQSSFTGQTHFVLGIIFQEINRNGNIPAECPLKANVMYEVHNYTVDPKYVSNFFPSMKWTALMKIFYKNKKTLELQFFGGVDKLK